MNGLLTELSAVIFPALIALFGTICTIIINRAAKIAEARWGIDIEARHRDALQSAIMSGIRSALARGLAGDEAVKAAIRHAAMSVPDALTALNPATGVLATIAEAKLREVDDVGRSSALAGAVSSVSKFSPASWEKGVVHPDSKDGR